MLNKAMMLLSASGAPEVSDNAASGLGKLEEVISEVDTVNEAMSILEKWFNNSFLPFLPRLATAIIVFIVGWLLTNLLIKLMVKIIKRRRSDVTVISFLKTAVGIVLKVCVGITSLAILGINVTAIITALGAAGVAVALALQNSLSNVASGILILVTKPFKVGDFVEINGVTGNVEEIQIFSTKLNTNDNKAITVPNSEITANTLINYSSQDLRRVDVDISISYDNDVEKAKGIIIGIIENDEFAMTDPKPIVRMGGHGESAVIIHVRVWCKSENYWNLYYDLYELIKAEFDKNDINIPFNQLDVHIDKNSNQ